MTNEHPYFTKAIKQLGLSNLVYPGAEHTRFSHALGAMYLMNQALDVLGQKGEKISEEEIEASLAAILLHDIGHSPFFSLLRAFLFSRRSRRGFFGDDEKDRRF